MWNDKKNTPMKELLQWAEYRQEKAANSQKAAWNMIVAKIKEENLIEKEENFLLVQYNKGLNDRPY